MDIRIVESYDEMSDLAAALVIDQVKNKPGSVLGLACGASPIGLYKRLVEAGKRGEVDFSRVKTVNADEYIGVPSESPDSYHGFMRKYLFDALGIKPENTLIPDGMAVDILSECARYSRTIKEWGGIDLMVLGIGTNAHIGFNEPGDAFVPETHVVELSEMTRNANCHFFANPKDMPHWAISMGIREIMFARGLILLASGAAKTVALGKMAGDITPQAPASILQLHRHVIIIADKAAAARLEQE